MKILTLPLLFLCTFITCWGQHNQTIPLQKFNELKVYDRISVSLVKDNENKLVIRGEDKDDVSIQESNGQLKIKMAIHEFLSGNTVTIKLHYTEPLTVIDANENARIISENNVRAGTLDIKAQEAGLIILNLEATTVHIKSTTGSEIKLSGTTQTQDIHINTGGKVDTKKLKSENTEVTVLAGGRAEIFATEKVTAKVKAGGNIIIHGNPKIVDRDDTFGGVITILQ
ncbi:head GIN domain-containing protein [Maribacter sp. MAR_2009_72]|uniref:head GIN domain-containing protein n=1 Tax=Maribacter sp. MAR_2009_72 TaxID=1250050 RepID=UPI0011997C55|nr:head GIN domain-containing protein [Maribacter sp. MAR_2009_72]TVZ15515.1 putative autotransporter adhesin-like protein [Maribacter sp. MAR_2009_72]